MSDDGPHWRALPNGRQYVPVTRKGRTQLLVWCVFYLTMTMGLVVWVTINDTVSSVLSVTAAFVVATIIAIVVLVRVVKRGL